MKLKERGIQDDLPLGDGWSQWVPSVPYRAYIKKYGYQTEVSHTFMRSNMFTYWIIAEYL